MELTMQEPTTQDTENENQTVEVDLEQSADKTVEQSSKQTETQPDAGDSTSGAEKSTTGATQAGDEELENHSEKVQKRIAKLTGRMREAERREKAAIEYAQSVQKQLDENKQKTTSLDSSFVNEFENRVTLQNEMLQTQLKEAIDRGDVDKQVEVQKQLATVAHENERLKYVKQQREQQKAVQATAQQPQQPQQAPQRSPDPKAKSWADQNEWFGQDEPMTLTAFSIHKKMIEEEGWDGATDEYYTELDKRIRREFPHKFNQENSSGRNTPAVASATRTTTKGKKSVKLSASQVAIAKKLGVSLEDYAKQVARLNP
jgi:hypothetical protein